MAALNTISLEDAVDLVNRKFEKKLQTINNTMRDSGFVIVETVPEGTGGTRRHKELPVGDLYASYKAQGGQITNTTIQQGYYKDTTATSFAKSVDITYEWRKLNKIREIRNAMDFIAGVYQDREDLNLSMHISYGTATTYTDQDGRTVNIATGDSLQLFYATHTLTGSTTTYRNILANNPQLSEGALELMEDLVRTNIYTNLGEQVTMDFDILYTTDHPATVNTARRLLQSTAQIGAPNEGVTNVYKAKYAHKILKRIDCSSTGAKDSTKAKYWGLASSAYSTFHLDVYAAPEMSTPAAGNNGEDFLTKDWTFSVIGMHDSCVVVGRGLTLSKGDGSA